MKRDEVLKNAMKLINGDRAKDYGDAYDNHKNIASLWSVVFGFKVMVWQVYLCLILIWNIHFLLNRMKEEGRKNSQDGFLKFFQ